MKADAKSMRTAWIVVGGYRLGTVPEALDLVCDPVIRRRYLSETTLMMMLSLISSFVSLADVPGLPVDSSFFTGDDVVFNVSHANGLEVVCCGVRTTCSSPHTLETLPRLQKPTDVQLVPSNDACCPLMNESSNMYRDPSLTGLEVVKMEYMPVVVMLVCG